MKKEVEIFKKSRSTNKWGYREEGGGDTKDQQVYYQGDMEKKEVVV